MKQKRQKIALNPVFMAIKKKIPVRRQSKLNNSIVVPITSSNTPGTKLADPKDQYGG